MTDKVTITREDLYKFVWEESLGKIAKRYGISPTEITEACNKLDIPKPQQGHWTKIDLGHQIPRPELPEPFYEVFKEKTNLDIYGTDRYSDIRFKWFVV